MKEIDLGNKKYKYECNVKTWRKFFGYSQAEVADIIGISRNTMSDIENEVSLPSVLIASALSVVLKTSVSRLFVFTPVRNGNCDLCWFDLHGVCQRFGGCIFDEER